jgi:hypothetical protein
MRIIALSGKKAAVKNQGRKNPHTPEWNAKIGASQRGKKLSIETRQKIAIATRTRHERGTWTKEQHREAMKRAITTKRANGYYKIHAKRHSEWMKINCPTRGKKPSIETRQKMSNAKKLFLANGGKPSRLGQTVSQQERKKRSENAKRMWKEGKFGYGNNGLWRSKLEIAVYEEFLRCDPKCQHSVPIVTSDKTYIFDIFVPSLHLMVEINGDYWHLNPTLYEANYIDKSRNVIAQDVWYADKLKKTVALKAGYNFRIVWELDIKKRGVINVVNDIML